MMKITKLSLSISVLSLLAALPSVQASELITNCTEVSALGGKDLDVSNDKSCAKLMIPFDFGDAPDPTFPSLRLRDGARHQLGTGLFLGKCVDADPGEVVGDILGGAATKDDASPTPPPLAYGDCSNPDDEDGVTVGNLTVGKQSVPVDIVASEACKLNAWIDWDGDGSWTGLAEQIFTDLALAPGNNPLMVNVPAFATQGDVYARFRCSSAGGDGLVGEAADGEVEDYKLTIGAQVKEPMSIGNFVWLDGNEDGVQTAGEFGLVDAVVSLTLADGSPARDLDGMLVGSQTITATGAYTFTNLPEGDYIVKVVPPAGYIPSPGGADVDTNISDKDSNCVAGGTGAQTLPFSLVAGTEPDAEGNEDTNTNLTVDCGFYKSKQPLHSLGNQVWVDDGAGVAANANNGLRDAGEVAAPNGVQIEFRDANGIVVKETVTANGFYLFSALAAGDYQVCLKAANFGTGAVLAGYSAGTGGNEANANTNVDNNDNGDDNTTLGLCSSMVTLADDEPLAETPTASGTAGMDGTGADDNRSNLTIDFALLPPKAPPASVAVGDRLWVDGDADGIQDAGEAGLEGATVTVQTVSGQAVTDVAGNVVGSQVTGADGKYLFSKLPAGDYVVTIQQPAGYYLTLGGLDVDDDTNNADSNCVVDKDGLVKTHALTLAEGSEPDTAVDGDGKNGNLTADCGFYRAVSIGDLVWDDKDADGQQDSGEPGLSGMVINITGADGVSPAYDVDGKQVTAITTGADGKYLFEDLMPGTYTLTVTPPEKGYTVSPGGADPDSNPSPTDSNCKAVEGGFQTPAFKVMSLDGKTGFANNTIDCGFYRPVGVGSRIWIDLDNDGKQDTGEPGVQKATVTLLTPDGKPATNIYGQVIAPQTTGPNGEYFFGNLREGDYIIAVTPPEGFLPTVSGGDPDNNDGTDSNGSVVGATTIMSNPISLSWGAEPDTDGDGDKSTNLTIGFGFVPTAGVQIPTVSAWGLGILSMLLSGLAFWRRRKD